MHPELFEVLREPGTFPERRLEPSKTHEGGVFESDLVSASSGRRYPVRDGIVRFAYGDPYADSFGLRWSEFSRVQIDSHNGASDSRNRFESETAWSEEELMGRRMRQGAVFGNRGQQGGRQISLDCSRAVGAARTTLIDRYPKVPFIEGDTMNLPFAPGTPEVDFSIRSAAAHAESREEHHRAEKEGQAGREAPFHDLQLDRAGSLIGNRIS